MSKKKIAAPHSSSAKNEHFKQILQMLRQRHNIDFSNYKKNTIERRIARRMSLNKINSLSAYRDHLVRNYSELKALFNDLLIGVTSFFRDGNSCDALVQTVFPDVAKNILPDESIRVWVAGCSTGEEAYSLAICLDEFFGEKFRDKKIQIFATDVSDNSISTARKGIYSSAQLKNISAARIKNYFTKTEDGIQVNKSIRDMCVFAVHNFLVDPPFANMHIVSCRNVLIYMDTALQAKALSIFHYALKEKGYLLLGKSETTMQQQQLFSIVSAHDKIYHRKAVDRPVFQIAKGKRSDFISKRIPTIEPPDYNKKADEILLTQHTPAGIIINAQNNIVHFNGNTTLFLGPSSGKASLNVLKMAYGDLAHDLRRDILHVRKTGKKIRSENIAFQRNDFNGSIDIEVIPLSNANDEHLLILFHPRNTEISKQQKSSKKEKDTQLRTLQLEHELHQAREDMRSLSEEQEAANEELQSANEELLSSSEELQSINEELEASQAELQANNHELLQTNKELSDREQELKKAHSKVKELAQGLEKKVVMRTKELELKNEALKTSEERYHRMVEEVQDYAIILLNTKGDIENWNKGAEHIKGYKSKEIVGKNFRKFYTKADLDRKLPDKLIALAKKKGRAINEGWRVRKDGTKFWGSITITALHNERGKVIGFSKVTRDLTEKKLSEGRQQEYLESIEQKNIELKQSEERYHRMVEEVQDYAIIMLSPIGDIENWNKGAERIKGYTAKEIVGKNFRVFYTKEDLEKKVPDKLIETAKTTGRATSEGWRVRGDGSRFWGSTTITALHGENNKLLGFSKVTRDLTEKKIAEENQQKYLHHIEQKNQELQKTNTELERFSYMASHDLQEPLRKIQTFSNRLQEKYHDIPAEMKMYLDKIDAASSRMSTLIRDLLEYSRLSNPEIEFEMVDLNDTAMNVLGDFELLIEQKNAKIKVKLLPEIEAIPVQMNQLFHNLIGNALKFSRENTAPEIQVSAKLLQAKDIRQYTSLSADLSYVELVFKDNGIGFPENQSVQIFALFKRLHERNKYQGTGIGLSLTKKIVEIHHGIIFAHSRKEQGAEFHILLPVKQSQVEIL